MTRRASARNTITVDFRSTVRSRRRRPRFAIRILGLLGVGLAGVARGQVITEFPVPTASSTPFSIAAGPDLGLWFTEGQGNKIGRSTIAGVITEFPVTTAASVPAGLALGPDGNLWFTEFAGNNIGRITTAGVVTEFPLPNAGSQASGIAAGPDGNLWFTELAGNRIGRITTSGVIVEFTVTTAGSQPSGIAAGPDGNLWFTEKEGNKIGRITTSGTITEFPVLTAASGPRAIAAGPDGNLWFTEQSGNRVGRITTAGVVTEFPVPTAGSQPYGIVTGSDDNLWFTELIGNKIGRLTTAGAFTEFPIATASSIPLAIADGPDGNLWFTEQVGNKIGRVTTGPATPQALAVDAHAVTGSVSNVNGVFEPGETVEINPSWKNNLNIAQALTGTASDLDGPSATYTIDDAGASYGTLTPAASADCHDATGDCYLLSVSGARPQAHWDAAFDETPSGTGAAPKTWTLHLGGSFADVPTSNGFYAFIENLFHNGITGGCAGGYCPGNPVTRAQMAVFLLKAKLGSAHVPPPCTGTVFADVPCTGGPFDPWIEELAGLGVTGGCGGGNYCPAATVTRKQMAVFLLKAHEGSAYDPPDCTQVFADVPCTPGTGFSDWIEELYARGITGGCSASPLSYCPDNPNNRGQMAVFLVKMFGLLLYGP